MIRLELVDHTKANAWQKNQGRLKGPEVQYNEDTSVILTLA